MDNKLIVLAIVALVAYYLYNKPNGGTSQTLTVPQEYKGTAGLNYIRQNYASEISQARSLCSGQFKGSWVDSSNSIGCYNMQGFSQYYCNINTLQNLAKLCNSIGGSPVCSSTQASCSV
jgi:hypothetical protein